MRNPASPDRFFDWLPLCDQLTAVLALSTPLTMLAPKGAARGSAPLRGRLRRGFDRFALCGSPKVSGRRASRPSPLLGVLHTCGASNKGLDQAQAQAPGRPALII